MKTNNFIKIAAVIAAVAAIGAIGYAALKRSVALLSCELDDLLK
ncbi:MAG: hypothetical protein WA093_04990 [Minisyncoccales bacterium]